MNKLPSHKWNKRKLGTLAQSIRESYDPNQDEALPYIGLEHIEQDMLCLNGLGYSSDTISTKKIFKAGDILFGSLRPYFRKVVKPKFPGVCSTDITVIRAIDDCVADFLFYFIANRPFIDLATSISSGTRMPRGNWATLSPSEWMVPIPQIQKEIGNILSAYDDLVENNARRIKILEEMAQSIYREWFVNFRFPGHENVRMVDSKLGKIPEGWEVDAIGNRMETYGGGTPSTKIPEYWEPAEITWFIPSDLTKTNAAFAFDSEKKISRLGLTNSAAKMFPAYSVMMTSRATIGATAINTVDACTNQGFITCVPNEILPNYQIYFWIKQNLSLIDSIASGATYKEISRSEFRELLIAIADKPIERLFVNTIHPIFKQIENLLLRNNNLRQTRDLLLPRLISGELDVSEIDIVINDNGGD